MIFIWNPTSTFIKKFKYVQDSQAHRWNCHYVDVILTMKIRAYIPRSAEIILPTSGLDVLGGYIL